MFAAIVLKQSCCKQIYEGLLGFGRSINPLLEQVLSKTSARVNRANADINQNMRKISSYFCPQNGALTTGDNLITKGALSTHRIYILVWLNPAWAPSFTVRGRHELNNLQQK